MKSEHIMKKFLTASILALCSVLIVSVTYAAKIGPGTSTGTGRIFFANPVAYLHNESLTDQKDADYQALQAAYVTKPLTNLDGSGFLKGDWATIMSETGNPAFSSTNNFIYNRTQDEFEQVMGYYWITEAQKYIQSLGFGTTLRPINKQSQRLRINQYGQDNSFATTQPSNEMRLGKGGVDDAEDGDVILHEYGHAIHFSQNFSFGTFENAAMSEGFGDYWAATVTAYLANQTDPACIADWDSTSYTSTVPHCLRRTDLNLHYPEDLVFKGVREVHFAGRVWSSALWAIRGEIGRVKADTSILEGQFDYSGTMMPDLAVQIVAAAKKLYNPSVAMDVRDVFTAHGLLCTPTDNDPSNPSSIANDQCPNVN